LRLGYRLTTYSMLHKLNIRVYYTPSATTKTRWKYKKYASKTLGPLWVGSESKDMYHRKLFRSLDIETNIMDKLELNQSEKATFHQRASSTCKKASLVGSKIIFKLYGDSVGLRGFLERLIYFSSLH